MLKYLIIVACAYIAYKLFAHDATKRRKNEKSADVKSQQSVKDQEGAGELVKDPICGAYVSLEDSLSVKNGENIKYFCGYECRDTYLKQLEKGGLELPPRPSGSDDDKLL